MDGSNNPSTEDMPMTINEARTIISTCNSDELADAVKTWANCREASIDDAGDIWIADPQNGHWLSEEKLIEFAEWCQKQ